MTIRQLRRRILFIQIFKNKSDVVNKQCIYKENFNLSLILFFEGFLRLFGSTPAEDLEFHFLANEPLPLFLPAYPARIQLSVLEDYSLQLVVYSVFAAEFPLHYSFC